MEYEKYNAIVLEHRNSLILIGVLVFTMCVVGMLVIEFYVRRELGCKYFYIKQWKFSPTFIMFIPLIVVIICFSIQIHKCNLDIRNELYDTYIGEVEYSSSSVKIKDNFSVFVGKGFEIIPKGKHIGKCVYSHNAHVIVYWEESANWFHTPTMLGVYVLLHRITLVSQRLTPSDIIPITTMKRPRCIISKVDIIILILENSWMLTIIYRKNHIIHSLHCTRSCRSTYSYIPSHHKSSRLIINERIGHEIIFIQAKQYLQYNDW